MNDDSKEPPLSGLYPPAVRWVFWLIVILALFAIGLSVYADEAGKLGGAVEDSITTLWRCVFLLVGSLCGLLAGPRLAAVQRG